MKTVINTDKLTPEELKDFNAKYRDKLTFESVSEKQDSILAANDQVLKIYNDKGKVQNTKLNTDNAVHIASKSTFNSISNLIKSEQSYVHKAKNVEKQCLNVNLSKYAESQVEKYKEVLKLLAAEPVAKLFTDKLEALNK